MDIKVDFDHQAVMDHVTKAILDSALGPAIRKVVEDNIKQLTSSPFGKTSPVEHAINQVVFEVVQNLVREEFKPKIEQKVREHATDEVLKKVTERAWEKLMEPTSRY